MPFSEKIAFEFWHHKERVAGKKGQQYIFRSKWFLLIMAICALTLIPLIISTILFYNSNKNETITDLLLETSVLAQGTAVDMQIYFDQYLSILQITSTQYAVDELEDEKRLASILKKINSTKIKFSSLNIFGQDGRPIINHNTKNIRDAHPKHKFSGLDPGSGFRIGKIIDKDGRTQIYAGLRLKPTNGKSLFLIGIIDYQTTLAFLEKLKVKNLVDIFLLDKNGRLVTPSAYFGQPGSKTKLSDFSDLPSSGRISFNTTEPDKKRFLFSGLSGIDNTHMRLGILMSDKNFQAFMRRITSHILIMTFLSVMFVMAAALLLVTYVVQVLYRADKVRQIYLTKAARNSKMASIGQLAAGVAHEINNPLAIINEKAGYLMDLFSFMEDYKGDTRLTSAVESIIKAVERAGTITHRLLGFARKTDSSIQTINIADTVQEVLGFVKKEAEYKSIRIDVQIPSPFPQIVSDRGKLQQILINLINNAIAALDENGTLTIIARTNIQNESIELLVQDNGCGISQEHQKKIFEPFFTTRAEIGGTGLGLSLTYGLIRDLHGTLALESTPGVGTTFTITLPLTINDKETSQDERDFSR